MFSHWQHQSNPVSLKVRNVLKARSVPLSVANDSDSLFHLDRLQGLITL